MKKGEIYVNLQGKTKEELTDLWEFLNDSGESNYSMLDEFISNTYWDYLALDTGDWALCKKSYTINKHEVTIEQLKQIIKPMETKFTPIAMKCTQEQFEAVKPKLSNCFIRCIDDFVSHNYLINNLSNCDKKVSNVSEKDKTSHNRTIYEEWNEEIFLKACGIEVETMENKFKKGDVVIITDFGDAHIADKCFTLNRPYKLREDLENGFKVYADNSGELNGYSLNTTKTMKFELYNDNNLTLEQQLEKAKAEVKRLKEEIESNKPKVGDWVYVENSECFFKVNDMDIKNLDNIHKKNN